MDGGGWFQGLLAYACASPAAERINYQLPSHILQQSIRTILLVSLFLLSHTSTIRLSNTMKRKTPAVANTGVKRQKAAPLSDEANNAQYSSS